MKRIIALLFTLIIFLSACASPTVPISAPVEQVEATSALQSTEVGVVGNTVIAASTSESTSTPTPVPPSPHWYWSVDDSDTEKVIAVNQFGERRELGALAQSDDLHTVVISLDDERALLFLDNDDTLRVYLLTPAGVQKIKLPDEPVYFNTELSQFSRAVVAVYADYAVFTYAANGDVGTVNTGPVYLVDLQSLTAKLIDEDGNRDPIDVNRAWFRISQDGRYLRYLNGNADVKKIEIRELDLSTGIVRTININQGPPARVHASPEGDMWYPDSANLILDLNGNQMEFADEAQMFTPLRDGKGLVYDWNCVDNCELKVITPFGNDAALTYNLPWTIEGASSYVNVRQVLPDQSLLFAGMPYATFSNAPAIVETYPTLTEIDIPLFRLTPDGQARLVGTYVQGDFTSNVSRNSQFILMKSIDKTSLFVYDAVADRPLFSMPIDTELEEPLVIIKFYANGLLANLSASVPGTKNSDYRNFYYLYDFKTATVLNWEDANAEINSCPDLLEDGKLVCWIYRTDSINFDLVRFEPATGIKIPLLEDVWLVDFTP